MLQVWLMHVLVVRPTPSPGLGEAYIEMRTVPQFQHFFFPGAPPPADEKFLAMCTFLTHPFSRGSVHIKSNDPEVPVVVDPRLFTHPLGKYGTHTMWAHS